METLRRRGVVSYFALVIIPPLLDISKGEIEFCVLGAEELSTDNLNRIEGQFHKQQFFART